MLFLYNSLLYLLWFLLKISAFFNKKIKLFVDGRTDVFKNLSQKIAPTDKTIWFHAASLGEYEQGLPVMEKIKKYYSTHKIVLTFFSPSGYEIRKNNKVADITVYLPLDTRENAKKFLQLVHPEMVFFIKYEFWPNYLNELKATKTPTYLISGIFRKKQLFFKWYGGFYRKALTAFNYFFVQNEASKKLLLALGNTNILVSGDTRFDRVAEILNNDNSLPFVEDFKNKQLTIVFGSTWPKDENLICEYIRKSDKNIKYIIAPHNINQNQIRQLQSNCGEKTILFSEKENKNLSEYSVLILDTIGILTKVYSYADIAYVGGGFGNPGVHNVLEPAVFGIPIIIGPNYQRFQEAITMVENRSCFSITNLEELTKVLSELLEDNKKMNTAGNKNFEYIQQNKGATNVILKNVTVSS